MAHRRQKLVFELAGTLGFLRQALGRTTAEGFAFPLPDT